MHAPSRRGMIILAAIAVLATIVVSQPVSRPTPGPAALTRADEVLLYGNGFGQVFRTFHVNVTDGWTSLDLPAGTITDLLRVQGLDVVEIVVRDAASLILPGDHVRVAVGGQQRFDGTVVAIGDGLVLETANGTRVLREASLASIELLDATQPRPGQLHVRLRVNDPDGPRKIDADFLVRGVGWHATHELDVGSGTLRTWAALAGLPGIEVGRLTLVSGAPRLVISQPDARLQGEVTLVAHSAADRDAVDNTWSSSGFDEYHEYTLGRAVEFPREGNLRLLLATNHVDLHHELVARAYAYGGDIPVQHEWSFVNPSKEPLAAGALAFYRDGHLIGQDSMAYLPRNEKTTLVSGSALDVKAQVLSSCIGPEQDRVDVTLTNRKTETATVHVVVTTGGSRIDGTRPAVAAGRDVAEWNVTLESDASTTVSLTHHHAYSGSQDCEAKPL